MNKFGGNSVIVFGHYWWVRSAYVGESEMFFQVDRVGMTSSGTGAKASNCVCPAWCF